MRLEILTLGFFSCANLMIGQVSLKQIDLEEGDRRVGFVHYLTYDSTRTYQRIYDWKNQSIRRPIPVSMWYPSDDNPKSGNMTILDYMEILKEEEEWEYLPNDQILNWFYYANTQSNSRHLKDKTNAYPNILPAMGKFPAIIYAPSYQASSIENFALCEYLASHGFVVIASPSRGTENRFMEGGTPKDLETQARDIEFLIKEVGHAPYADLGHIATMGFSFGGLSNVLAQSRNESIKAIVCLDGSIRYQYPTIKESPFFDINKVDVPFIHMAQKEIPLHVLQEDGLNPELNYKFTFYDSLENSQAYSLIFHNLTHPHFSTLGVLFEPRDDRQDKGDFEIMESYKWVGIYTLNFLEAFLKDHKNALGFLDRDPEQNGIGNGSVSKKSKGPITPTFSFHDFNAIASQQHYENLGQLYESSVEEYPQFEIPEASLNNLGLQLLFNPKTSADGIKVLLFATTLYPRSANLFDSLGEGYLFIGNAGRALESFERSLELNPQNQNAVNRLKQLRK